MWNIALKYYLYVITSMEITTLEWFRVSICLRMAVSHPLYRSSVFPRCALHGVYYLVNVLVFGIDPLG